MKYEIKDEQVNTMFAAYDAILKREGLSLQAVINLLDSMRNPVREEEHNCDAPKELARVKAPK